MKPITVDDLELDLAAYGTHRDSSRAEKSHAGRFTKGLVTITED